MRVHVHVVIFILILSGCNDPDSLSIELPDAKTEIKISRLDKEMFEANTGELLEQIPEWRKAHPGFFELYCERILRLPAANDTLLATALTGFLKDKQIREVFDSSARSFPDMKNIEEELKESFAHYQYYFPDKPIPTITTLISGFNYSIVCGEKEAGISLEMYLGEGCDFYNRLMLPKYRTVKMRREYICPDLMKAWGQTEFEPENEMKNFLENIVFHGKVLYFLDAMMPELHDSLKLGYSESEIEFCNKNEASIWSLFVGQNLLFSTNPTEYEKYLLEGPGTNGLPKEAPAMLGIWTGWRIVQKYMKENKNVSLSQLMMEQDAGKILARSKYKPE